jgi:putative addiction module component (TIGR02574 family)
MLNEELKSAIDKLEVSEKLILIEEVWDDIAKSNQQLPLPEWQKRELSKRLSAYDHGETGTKDFLQVHDALRIKYK